MKLHFLILLASIVAIISAEEFTKEEVFCGSYKWKGVFYGVNYENYSEYGCYDIGVTSGKVYPKKMFRSNPKVDKCGVHATNQEDGPDIITTYEPCKGRTVDAHYMFKPKSHKKLGKFLFLQGI
ncbi:hypothetical protein HDU92_004850 [Lobulomyces angularis]|nr:hypothetical protein HDU92_004850 [Lobulomyces angularis]